MEILEFLQSSGVQIHTPADQLKKYASAYKSNPGTPTRSVYKIMLEVKKPGQTEPAISWDAFLMFLQDNKETFSTTFGVTDPLSVDGIVKILTSVAETKIERKKKVKEKTVEKAVSVADYNQPGMANPKTPLTLFNTTTKIDPNEYDRDLLGCFACMGNSYFFHDGSKAYRLMTQFSKNTEVIVFSGGESGVDGVFQDIVNYMQPKWELYFKRLKKKIAELDEFSDDPTPIENIYLHDVPTVMRYVTSVYRVYETGKTNYFDHYRVSSNLFDASAISFVEWLQNNLTKAIRGVIEVSDHFSAWSNDPGTMALNHFLIWPEEQWKNARMPKKWKAFLEPKMSKRLLNRLLFFIGSLLDDRNKSQQYLAISDEGQTGKGVLVTLLDKILPKNSIVRIDNLAFNNDEHFYLSSINVWNYHIGVVNEYDGKSLNSERGKSIVGGDKQSLDMKFMKAVDWDTGNFRIIVPSNRGFVLKEHSLRRRCIPITFKATHNSMDNFNDEQIDEIAAEGNEFLKYCWRVYQDTKLRQNNGGYWVACEEDEKLMLDGKFFAEDGTPKYSDHERLLRAFSRDQEIAKYYTVDDYEDSELTEGFNRIIDTYFDVAPDDYVLAKDFFALMSVESRNMLVAQTFDDALRGKGMFTYNSRSYKLFKKFLDNHGHRPYRREIGIIIPGYKIKQKYLCKVQDMQDNLLELSNDGDQPQVGFAKLGFV